MDALSKVPSPDLLMMPPTYISLWSLRNFNSVDEAKAGLSEYTPERFETRFARADKGFITLWPGDSAYDDLDFTKDGPKRRLYAESDRWRYETDFR